MRIIIDGPGFPGGLQPPAARGRRGAGYGHLMSEF
ncbi:MAG: hypothetical protein FAZ92_00160 [Accumulibacter sp.]|nr:MAG: hypothetical protein FAZ92_00160 [Accumulibacter sp.]